MKKAILIVLLISLSISLQGCLLWSLKCGWEGGWGCPTREEIRGSYRTEIFTLKEKMMWTSGMAMTLVMSGEIGELVVYYDGNFGDYLVVGQKYPVRYSPYFSHNMNSNEIVDIFYNLR